MKNFKSTRLVFLFVALLAFSLAVPAVATQVKSFDEAKQLAQKENLPILVKVGIKWSKASEEFDKVLQSDDEFRASLMENVIFCSIGVKEKDGVGVAGVYTVRNYPTFILTNSSGEIVDRWYGFGCHDCFLKRLVSSLDDPVTVNERLERFQKVPTEQDARKLGDIRHAEGMFAEAAAYYRRAQEINPSTDTNYAAFIFNSMAYGNYYQLYSSDQVRAQADIVLTSDNRSDKDLLKVALSMYKISLREGEKSLFVPYLKVAVEQTADSQDEGVVEKRAKLIPEYTLYVSKDVDRAVALRKAAMPDGWLEDANQLNIFAWWCFQNEVNLTEAETMARRGIELAPAGREKANILDTLAEVCNLSGDCGEAVEYTRLAIAEDPENEYFQEQLVRFEQLLAAQR